MGYKILGFAVWHGGRWYLARKYGKFVPSRRVVVAGLVGAGIATQLARSLKADVAH